MKNVLSELTHRLADALTASLPAPDWKRSDKKDPIYFLIFHRDLAIPLTQRICLQKDKHWKASGGIITTNFEITCPQYNNFVHGVKDWAAESPLLTIRIPSLQSGTDRWYEVNAGNLDSRVAEILSETLQRGLPLARTLETFEGIIGHMESASPQSTIWLNCMLGNLATARRQFFELALRRIRSEKMYQLAVVSGLISEEQVAPLKLAMIQSTQDHEAMVREILKTGDA